MHKEKEKKILPTLKFMLKTAVKNKPQLFIAYALPSSGFVFADNG